MYIDLINEIISKRTYKHAIGLNDYPKQGQFISTGMQASKDKNKLIGYCVQIRKGVGEYGTDAYFLRHADGKLTVHENQNFYSLTKDQEKKVRAFFAVLPEQEDYSLPYSMKGGEYEETGFIIEKKDMKKIPPTETKKSLITITEFNKNGVTKITVM